MSIRMKAIGWSVRSWMLVLLLILASSGSPFVQAAAGAQPGLRDRGGVAVGTGVVDVGAFGAVPNTGTDQSIPIMLALLQAKANGGGTVAITVPGTYLISLAAKNAGLGACVARNACLTIGSNVYFYCASGVELREGLAKDDTRCYLICNDDPSGGNTNITLDGGFINGGSVIEESVITDGTHVRIPGSYAARFGTGVAFTVSSIVGKVAFTVAAPGATYDGTNTTIPVASSTSGAGGLQTSWQAAQAQNPAITGRTIGAPGVLVVSGDYTAYAGVGSVCYVTQNAGATANTTTGYTIASAAFAAGSTTITMTGALEGTTTVSGKVAFNYPTLWYQDGALFNNVSRLTIKNMKWGGWDKYAVWFVNCNRFLLSDNEFNNPSDGFHVGGLCKNGVIRNTRGRCLDNMIPLVSNEVWYRPALYATTCGDISGILIDGFFCDSSIGTCLEPVRLTGKTYAISDCTIRGGRGTVGAGYCVRLGDDNAATYGMLAGTPMNRILIQDIAMTAPTGYALVDLSGYGINSVTLRDIRVQAADNKAVYVHSATSATTQTTVAKLIIDGLTNDTATTEKLVQIDAFVTDFVGLNWNTTLGVSGYTLHVNAGSLGTEGQIYHGVMSNCVSTSKNASGTSTHYAFTQTTLHSQLSMNNCTIHQAADVSTTFFLVNGILNLGLTNCAWDGSNTAAQYIYLNAATAWLRVSGSGLRVSRNKNTPGTNNASALNFAYTDIGTLIAASSSSAKMNSTNPDLPLDITTTIFGQAMVTNSGPVTGDKFYNVALVTGSTGGTAASPGAGTMHFVADNGAAGGTSSSGYWEMVGTPKPLTLASSGQTYTISKFQSKMSFEVTGTAGCTFQLPPAQVGMTFTFLNSQTGAGGILTVQGGTNDAVQKSSQVYSANNGTAANTGAVTSGSSATWKCIAANKWTLIAQSTTIPWTINIPSLRHTPFLPVDLYDRRRIAA